MNKISLVSIILTLFLTTNAIYFHVTDGLPHCLLFDKSQEKYNFYYQFIEQYDSQDRVVIKTHPSGQVIETLTGDNQQAQISGQQQFSICFIPGDSGSKFIIMDIWTDDHHHIKSLALKGQMQFVVTLLSNVSSDLNKIAHLQKMQEQKTQLMSQIVVNNENILNRYGLIKIILILGLVILQIVFLKKTLKNQGNKLMI